MADLTNYKIYKNNDFEILTDDGYKDFEGLIVGENSDKIELTFEKNLNIICTPKHKILIDKYTYKYANELAVGDYIWNKLKLLHIKHIKNDDPAYEFLHIKDNHKYFANGILCRQCLIIDEMAHIPDFIMEEFWESVIPIISSGKTTKIFAVSTPKGTGNLFYKTYSAAERGELKMWKAFRIDWWEIPGRDEKWKATMQEIMIKQNKSFAQEFENSFIDDGETATDTEVLEKMKNTSRNPKYIYEDGNYKVWLDPNPNNIYTIGVDVSEGIGGAASVATVFDITNLTDIKQAAVFHNSTIEPYHFAEFLNKMGHQWGTPPLLIERNGPGGQVIDALKEIHKYPNIVSYASENQNTKGRLGVYSHTNSKNKGVTNMRYWVNSLQVVDIYDLATIQELETFVRYPNGTWKKKPGNYLYDDRVHAMIWALFILHEELVHEYFEVLEYDSRGKPLKIKKILDSLDGDYELDPYYSDNDSPMPAYFNYSKNSGVDELESEGWKIWTETRWGGDFFDT